MALSFDTNIWRNKRRMAYIALGSTIVFTIFFFVICVINPIFVPLFVFDEFRIRILSDVIEWFYLTMASIIGAYIGFTSWIANRHIKSQPDKPPKPIHLDQHD